jgi:hypothetical protein
MVIASAARFSAPRAAARQPAYGDRALKTVGARKLGIGADVNYLGGAAPGKHLLAVLDRQPRLRKRANLGGSLFLNQYQAGGKVGQFLLRSLFRHDAPSAVCSEKLDKRWPRQRPTAYAFRAFWQDAFKKHSGLSCAFPAPALGALAAAMAEARATAMTTVKSLRDRA